VARLKLKRKNKVKGVDGKSHVLMSKHEDYGEGRRCKICRTPLTRKNPSVDLCFLHQRKEAMREIGLGDIKSVYKRRRESVK